MLKNDDRISRPARGRLFPVAVAETVRLIQELGFSMPIYRKRLDITFQNPDGASDLGSDVAALYPADRLIIYSLPEDFDRLRAKEILEVALRELAKLGKYEKPTGVARRSPSAYILRLRPSSLSRSEPGERR